MLLVFVITFGILNVVIAKPQSVLIGGTVTPFFSVQIETVPAHIGKKGMAKAIFKPAEGFKWNKDYPSTLNIKKINSPIAVLLEKEVDLIAGKVCVPYMGKEVGRIEIEGRINFSICNKKECKVFRHEKITLILIVSEKNESQR